MVVVFKREKNRALVALKWPVNDVKKSTTRLVRYSETENVREEKIKLASSARSLFFVIFR